MKLGLVVVPLILMGITQTGLAATQGNFKRFSVSAGWLHVMPQGKANPFNINTAVENGTTSKVGSISKNAFLNSIDPNATTGEGEYIYNFKDSFEQLMKEPDLQNIIFDASGNVKADLAGTATISGLEQWQGTGLEAEDVDTLGLTFNYYINDNRSLAKVNSRASNSPFQQLNSFLDQIVSVYFYSVLSISENV